MRLDVRPRAPSPALMLALAAALWLGSIPAALAAPAVPGGAPETIDPASFGAPSFDEDFKTFDHGVDQVKPEKPHRWRTVSGSGGPLSPSNRGGRGNDQTYIDPAFGGLTGCKPLGLDPFVHAPGQSLTIVAKRLAPPEAACLGRNWSSGEITTKFSFSQTYGYFEMRAQIPANVRGAWPAFWLIRADSTWPPEIDALETIGDGRVHVGLVRKELYNNTHTYGSFVDTPPDVSAAPHRYGVLWTAKTVGFYLDRKKVFEAPTSAGMDQPMFMIANLAIGTDKTWPKAPDPATREARMTITRITAWPLR